jgi:hypothetical protein
MQIGKDLLTSQLTAVIRSPVPNHRATRRISKASGQQSRSGTRALGYRAAFSLQELWSWLAAPHAPSLVRAVLIGVREPPHSNFGANEKDAGGQATGGPPQRRDGAYGDRLINSGSLQDISQVSGPQEVLSLRLVWTRYLTCWPFAQAVCMARGGPPAAVNSSAFDLDQGAMSDLE